jgi:hypothetical protein
MAELKEMSVEELHAHRAETYAKMMEFKAEFRKAGKLLDFYAQGKDKDSLEAEKARVEADIEALENM